MNLGGANAVRVTGNGVTARVVGVDQAKEQKLRTTKKIKDDTEKPDIAHVSVTIAADAAPGERDIRLVTPNGVSNRYSFSVGQLREVNEVEPNSEKKQAQHVDSLPVLINGQIMPGDRDFVRFAAKAGQTLVCRAQARELLPYIADAVPGWFQATLTLYDGDGKELAYVDDFRFKPDPVLLFKVPKNGEYLLEIKDALYRGREDFVYRLSIGALPFITHIFPLGGQRNTKVKVELHGVNLLRSSMDIEIPTTSPARRYVRQFAGGVVSNALPFAVDFVRETFESEPNDSATQANRVDWPIIINGRIERPGDVDYFVFPAQNGQKLVMDLQARRLDSPLDSIITLLDSKGRELAENDDTVDEAESLITHHADSHLEYMFRANGNYLLRVADVQGKGGEEYAYRLSISPPRPGFDLTVAPDNPTVPQGGTAAITVNAMRKAGFPGEISLTLQNLPKGYLVSNALIPAGQNQARFTITAPADFPTTIISPTIMGTAVIGNKPYVRRAVPAEELMQAFAYTHFVPSREFLLAVTKPSPFSLSPEVPKEGVLDIPAGGDVKVIVHALRKGEAKGPITVTADRPIKGIFVSRGVIPVDNNETSVTITVAKQIPVGFRQNVILMGIMRAGRETARCVIPAIPVRVIGEKK